ncbi:hypothetical protein [Haloferula sp.]|uniref:hypothetical protein n=1 Tax=Haloferula sp. TaxID=2497595 RepID=UPI003C73A6D7
MLDQCTITVPNGPLVKPEIFTDENFEIDGWLQFHAVLNNNHRQWHKDGPIRTGKWKFDLFGDRVLRFRTTHVGTRKDPCRQVIDQIELNLAKIAHGHNAIPISHERELCGLLILVRHVLSGVLVDPTKASTLIPGLVKNSGTHWSKIEIGTHIEDPGKTLFRLMRRMRSTRARNLEFLKNTVRLNGTNVMMKVYDKTAAMIAKKHGKKNLRPSTNHPITRLELELTNNKTTSLLPLPDGTPALIRKDDGKLFLEGFTLEHLKLTHRDYFSDIKGIFHAGKKPGDGEQAGLASLLAAVHLRSEMPVDDLLDLYVELGMRDRKKPRTEEEEKEARQRARRDMRARIELFLEASSSVTAEELLSDDAYRRQPIIAVEGAYGVGDMYIHKHKIDSIWEFAHDPHADRRINEVYMVKNPTHFDPITEFTWWSYTVPTKPKKHRGQ